MKVNWDDFSQYMEKSKMFQTTNQIKIQGLLDTTKKPSTISSRNDTHVHLLPWISVNYHISLTGILQLFVDDFLLLNQDSSGRSEVVIKFCYGIKFWLPVLIWP